MDERMKEKIDFIFYMTVANTLEYPEEVRNNAKALALGIATAFGFYPERKTLEPSDNAKQFMGDADFPRSTL